MGAAPPTKILNSCFAGVSHCYACVDGGWFKTRNGLTERAETMLLKLQCYWLKNLVRRDPHSQIKYFVEVKYFVSTSFEEFLLFGMLVMHK